MNDIVCGLVVFGAGLDALPIIDLAANLGWHTTVVDTRARASTLERFRKADTVLLCRPEDITSQASLFEHSLVVVMTHNYLHDLEILRQLLPMRLQYLGCLGPRRRTERLTKNLAAEDSPKRVHALSVVTEIKTVISERNDMQLKERERSIHDSFNAIKTSRFSLPTPETSWTGLTGCLRIDKMNPVNPA